MFHELMGCLGSSSIKRLTFHQIIQPGVDQTPLASTDPKPSGDTLYRVHGSLDGDLFESPITVSRM